MLRLGWYRLFGWLVAVCGAAYGWHRLHGFVIDDSYISYRYAMNLALGKGFTYNAGLRQPGGATAPLYVLLLAALYFVHHNIRQDATVVFFGCLAIAGGLVFEAGSIIGKPLWGIMADALLVSSPWLLSMRGMESALFLSLCTAAVYLYLRRMEWATGFVLGFATLTRGDAAALAIAVAVAWLVRYRRPPWRMTVAGLLVLVPWAATAKLWFGTVVPQTLSGKIAQGRSGLWGTGVVFLKGLVVLPHHMGFAVWFGLVVVAAMLGLVAVFSERTMLWLVLPVTAYSAAVMFLYGIVWRVPDYSWYYVGPLLVLCLLAGAGLGSLADLGFRTRVAVPICVGVGGLLVCVAVGFRETPSGFPYMPYEEAAIWLSKNSSPRVTLAASEIGVLGWYSHRRMIDYLGLLTKTSADLVAQGNVTAWLEVYKPDYWVVHIPPWVQEQAVELPWFAKVYTPVYDRLGIVIYKKVGSVSSAVMLAAQAQLTVSAQMDRVLLRRGVVVDKAESQALLALLRVYQTRPGLQSAFGPVDGCPLASLTHWAVQWGLTIDPARGYLMPYANALKALNETVSSRPGITVNCTVGEVPPVSG